MLQLAVYLFLYNMFLQLSNGEVQICAKSINWLLRPIPKIHRIELLVIGPKHKVNPPIKGIHVAGEYIEVSNNARNIGVIFYAHVNLEKHVINTCKTAFYHLRNIAKIRNCLSQDNAETLVHAFISSKPNRLLISYSMYKTAQLDWWLELEAQNI